MQHHLYAYYQPIYGNNEVSCLPNNQPHLFVAVNSLSLISDSRVKNIKQRNSKMEVILSAAKLYNSSTQYNFHFAHTKKFTPPHFDPNNIMCSARLMKSIVWSGEIGTRRLCTKHQQGNTHTRDTLNPTVQLSLVKCKDRNTFRNRTVVKCC